MRRNFAIALILAFVATAGCGGEASPKPGEPTVLRVGILPVANVAPIHLGIKKDFFADEKLKIELVRSQGGAAIVPAVVSGDFQLGYGNVVSLMQAREKGLGLQIVTAGAQSAADESTSGNALLVAPDSGIDSVDDVAGKSVAVTTVNNIGELTTRAALESHGVDHGGLKFVELGFPDMNAAVLSGDVDVAWQAEPFVTMGEAKGLRSVTDPFLDTLPKLDAAVYFGAENYVKENADVVKRFQRAMARSMKYARDHDDEAHKIVLTYTKIPPDVAKEMQLAEFSPTVNMKSIRLQATLAKKYGLLKKEADVDALLAPGAA